MTRPDFIIRQGDAGGRIESVLEDADGVAVDLSDASVTFVMARISGGAAVLSEAAVNVQDDEQGADGSVAYEWQPGDTDEAGSFLACWPVDFSGSTVVDASTVTYPNSGYISVLITEQIA